MHSRKLAAALATATAIGTLATSTATASAAPTTRMVRPGQSIQTAIDRAAPGDVVVVQPGTYAENLLVTKPVTLRGVGSVLLEPAQHVRANVCTRDPDGQPFHGRPFSIGICIVGRLGPIPPGEDVPTVLSDVPDVRVQGLELRGFAGGLLALGTRRLSVTGVEADHDGDGIFAEAGRDGTLAGNRAHDNEGAGLQVRTSFETEVARNAAYRNTGEGVEVLDSTGGRVEYNHLNGNCAGLAILDTAEPGPAGRMLVTGNEVRANNRFCPAGSKPSEGGAGVGLLGTTGVQLASNRIVDNRVARDPRTGQPPQFGGFGVLLADATHATGGGAPTGNRIVGNTILGNRPLDVAYDGSGSNNAFRRNDCTQSNPAAACR